MSIGVAKNIRVMVAGFCVVMLFGCSNQSEETPSESASAAGQPKVDVDDPTQNETVPATSEAASAEDLSAYAEPLTSELLDDETNVAGTGQSSHDNGGLSEAPDIDQNLLSAMQKISEQQSAATEQDSVDELAQLSETDRQALQDIAAQQTMVDAEEKATLQAEKNEASRAEQQQVEDSQ